MSAIASVTFDFDGTEQEFKRFYDAIVPIGLDIGAYSEGRTGVIEFMIDDFGTFKDQVARKAAELGTHLVALDYLPSERKAQQIATSNAERRSGFIEKPRVVLYCSPRVVEL